MKLTLKNLYTLFGLDKVDWKKATTRLLAVLWGTLLVCFAIKMLGGNLFEIIATNQTYIKMCELLEKSKLYYVVYFPFYVLSCYIPILVISREKPKKKDLILLIPILGIYVIKVFNNSIGFAFEILMYFIVSFMCSKKPWRALETIIVTLLFQIISLITKNIGYKLDYENVITSLIYMFDYYIMMLIYCVNPLIRKESLIMGLLGPFLLSKKGDQLVAYRLKLLDKRAKIDAEIKEIDREIENEKQKFVK